MTDEIASEVNGQAVQEPTVDGAGEGQALHSDASETQGQPTQEPARRPTGQSSSQATNPQDRPADAQPEVYTPEQVEQMRREWQSRKDRELHEARMQFIREQEDLRRQAEERERLEQMDDEEYGAYMRQQQSRQQELTAYAQQELQRTLQAIQVETLSAIPDAALRRQVEEKINAGQYKSWAELQQDVLEGATQSAINRAVAKAVKEATEAAQREATAQLADTPTPVLGSGLPTQGTPEKLSSEQLLAQGFAEAIQAKKRGR